MDKGLQAAEEAERLKKLMGSLRYLFRNSYSVLDFSVLVTKPMKWDSAETVFGRGWVLGWHLCAIPGSKSLHPKVSELKSYLRSSPRSDVPLHTVEGKLCLPVLLYFLWFGIGTENVS